MDSPGQQPPPALLAVASLRARLWDAGFRPVAIYNADSRRTHSPGKAPKGEEWTDRNRRDPPADAVAEPDAEALNTGILCDGLRAIDIDIDNLTMAETIKRRTLDRLGECPMRYRSNSGRVLLLYRAAEGQPVKRVIAGTFGKVEVLGRGQQFVAFGLHPSGAQLQWMPEQPGEICADHLPEVTEAQITELLAECAPVIAAKPESKPTDRANPQSSRFGPRAEGLQVVAALYSIDNTGPADWEQWNRVGMAIWAATGGSHAGMSAFHAWSESNSAYDPTETDRRWNHYSASPPTQIGAGTLFYMAREAAAARPNGHAEQQEGRQEGPEPEEQPEERPGKKSKKEPLPVVWFDDIRAQLDAQDFVEGLLMIATMSVIYGASNSGKSFWALDLALHVAAGMAWNGREVERGAVLWLAMEGAHGTYNRVCAWRDEHGMDAASLPFAIVPVSLNLLDPNADTSRLIEAISEVKAHFNLPVIWTVVDTLSRAAAGGNENAPDVMGAIVTNGARIQQETGSALSWIHHSGKDELKGARGHSLLRAATDTEIEIVAGAEQRTASVMKQREVECSGVFPFRLRVVELGTNKRGKVVTSCVVDVVEASQPGAAGAAPPRLIGHARRAFEVLLDLIAGSGIEGFAGVPPGCASVPAAWWRDRFYERAMPAAEQAARQRAFRRAADDLVDRHLVGMAGGRVWNARRGEPGQPGHQPRQPGQNPDNPDISPDTFTPNPDTFDP